MRASRFQAQRRELSNYSQTLAVMIHLIVLCICVYKKNHRTPNHIPKKKKKKQVGEAIDTVVLSSKQTNHITLSLSQPTETAEVLLNASGEEMKTDSLIVVYLPSLVCCHSSPEATMLQVSN